MKQYEKIGERTFSINELRILFQIEDNEYARYNDFKRKVILQAQKEINSKTDISFNFEEIKSGRRVTYIRFVISSNTAGVGENIADMDESIETDDKLSLVKTIIHEDITDLEAAGILQAAKDNINIIKEKYEVAKVTSNINNIVSWMKDAIKNNYQMPNGKSNKTFSQYDQREYDFNELEKKLLGWEEVAAE